MGSDEEKYKPKSIFAGSNSFRSLRVFGELHLEGYQVTFSKDNFDFRDDEEEEFLDKLKEEMNSYPLPILMQADKYREKVNKETKSNFQKLTNKAFEDIKLTQKIEELNIAVAEQTNVQGGIEKIFPNLGKNKIDKFEGIEIKMQLKKL